MAENGHAAASLAVAEKYVAAFGELAKVKVVVTSFSYSKFTLIQLKNKMCDLANG